MTFFNGHLDELQKLYSDSELRFLAQYISRENSNLARESIIERLINGEPIDYILGHTYFFGFKFYVNQDVLIPRPETEELVEWIISENKGRQGLRILDIGTGSGCIAISLAKYLVDAKVHAIDVSKEAFDIAIRNDEYNQTTVEFQELDILNQSNWKDLGQYDIIVSNPPYIAMNEMDSLSPQVKDFEPQKALFVDDQDPFIFYSRILEFGMKSLSKNGIVYFETHQNYQLKSYKGYQMESRKDLSQNDRFLKYNKL